MTPSLWMTSVFGMRLSLIRRFFTLIEKLLGFNISLFDQHREIYKEAFKYLDNNNIELVISTGEPFILFKYGSKLKKKYTFVVYKTFKNCLVELYSTAPFKKTHKSYKIKIRI